MDAPDFLRLGLMLALERRPAEPRGRTVLLQVREAGADGLFVQREINGDAVDLVAMFELHAQLVYEAATRMAAGSTG